MGSRNASAMRGDGSRRGGVLDGGLGTMEELRVRDSISNPGDQSNAGEITYFLQHIRPASTLLDLSFLHPIANANELSVDVLERGDDTVLEGLAYLFLDEAGRERAERLV